MATRDDDEREARERNRQQRERQQADDARIANERREQQAKALDWTRKNEEGRRKSQYNRELMFDHHTKQWGSRGEMWNMKDRTDTWSLGHETGVSQRKLRYYTVLTDPAIGIYEPKAKAQALAMYKIGFRAWHHHYTIDIIEVTIDLFGRNVHISLTPDDNFDFEFMTSGWPVVTEVVAVGGVGYTAYKGVCVSVRVAVVKGSGVTVKPKIVEYRRTAAGRTGGDLSTIKRNYMVRMISEPVALPDAKVAFNRPRFPRNLFEAWTPHHPHTGVHFRDTQRVEVNNEWIVRPQPNPGGWVHHSLRDFGYDVPYVDNMGTDPIRNAYLTLDTDWPRACGIQSVTDEQYGTREFAFYVDAFNVFHVFPTAAIVPAVDMTQNVPEAYVQHKTPAIPAWVYKPTVKLKDYFAPLPPPLSKTNEALIDFPELDWKFNHLGTKAVAVVYEREPYNNDTTYWSTDVGANPWTPADFADMNFRMGVLSRHNAGIASGYGDQRYFMAPGILEITAEIVLTGPSLEEYAVTLTVVERRRPTTMTRCALLAGYCWHDCYSDKKGADGKKLKLASAGDLCVLDIERWGSGMRFEDLPPNTAYVRTQIENILSLRKLGATPAEDVEINSFRGMPVLAADMNTLSFAFMPNHIATTTRQTFPTKTGYVPVSNYSLFMFEYDFAVMIVHSGLVKDFLFPATMTPARQQALKDKYAVTGRDFITAKSPAWIYTPPSGLPGQIGWTDTAINNQRRGFAAARGYKTGGGGGAYNPDVEAKLFGLWGQELGDDTHMYMCTNPHWGWSCYSSVICSYMWMDATSTFYAHPNGTWAFYSDQFIYMNQTVMAAGEEVDGQYVASNTINSLFDPKLIEHVIFDKVHFELRTIERQLGTANATFTGMYNKAVASALKLNKLQDLTISPIDPVAIRATFSKSAVDWGAPFSGLTTMMVEMTWYGAVYKYPEWGVQGGTYYNVLLPIFGGLVGLNMAYPVWTKDGFLATPSDDPEVPHLRFCDPIVLSNLR